ncbi:hypothetical protein BKA81DRAFT_422572 [Phyllosticta paracitricarpa]
MGGACVGDWLCCKRAALCAALLSIVSIYDDIVGRLWNAMDTETWIFGENLVELVVVLSKFPMDPADDGRQKDAARPLLTASPDFSLLLLHGEPRRNKKPAQRPARASTHAPPPHHGCRHGYTYIHAHLTPESRCRQLIDFLNTRDLDSFRLPLAGPTTITRFWNFLRLERLSLESRLGVPSSPCCVLSFLGKEAHDTPHARLFRSQQPVVWSGLAWPAWREGEKKPRAASDQRDSKPVRERSDDQWPKVPAEPEGRERALAQNHKWPCITGPNGTWKRAVQQPSVCYFLSACLRAAGPRPLIVRAGPTQGLRVVSALSLARAYDSASQPRPRDDLLQRLSWGGGRTGQTPDTTRWLHTYMSRARCRVWFYCTAAPHARTRAASSPSAVGCVGHFISPCQGRAVPHKLWRSSMPPSVDLGAVWGAGGQPVGLVPFVLCNAPLAAAGYARRTERRGGGARCTTWAVTSRLRATRSEKEWKLA